MASTLDHRIEMPVTSKRVTLTTISTVESPPKKYLDDLHTCRLPYFTLTTIILEIIFFIYLTLQAGDTVSLQTVVQDSIFIYRPDVRYQVWRFFTYSLIHANAMHLLFNIIFQLILGFALEYIHGSGRLAIIFTAGVFAGSLATSVFSARSALIGVSSGLYAILASHLINVILNYHHLKWAPLWLTGIFICTTFDLIFALYDKYNSNYSDTSPISFTAHLAGTISGLSVSILVLKQFDRVSDRHQLIWWCSLGITCSLFLAGILYNLMHPQIL